MNRLIPAVVLSLAALPAAASAAPRIEVTRFHLGDPARSGTIMVEEMPGNADVSLEFRTYADAVMQGLQRVGFTTAGEGATSDYVARVSFSRSFRPSGVDRSGRPVSVGVGGGVGSHGSSGFGLGIGINLSGKPKDIVTTEISVQIRRRADATVIWEGRASTEARENRPEAQPATAARNLAAALMKDYPGESGRTISVK